MSNYLNYSYEQLKKFCNDCFMKFGFTEDESNIITDVLLLSDLYGIESHGMQRLARYHKGIEKGLIKVDAKPEVVFETPVSAVIEGNDGMGQLISHKAMNIAIEKAKEIALQHAGLKENEVSRLRAEKDRDDGRTKYDVEFQQGRMEYDYEIHAETGKILKAEKDYDD